MAGGRDSGQARSAQFLGALIRKLHFNGECSPETAFTASSTLTDSIL